MASYDQMELQDIFDEINGHIHSPVPGFFAKYFTERTMAPSWSILKHNPRLQKFLYSKVKCQWAFELFLNIFQEDRVFRCYRDYACEQSMARYRVVSRDVLRQREFYKWEDVKLVGLFQKTQTAYGQGILQLCIDASEVFLSQPTRLFLHGFHVFGSQTQLWVFDRSGLYGSETFEMHEEPERLITIFDNYSKMSDTELGVNPLVHTDDTGNYITCQLGNDKESKGKAIRLYLEEEPIADPFQMVSQGPICFPARCPGSQESEFVVKFSWRSSNRRRPENIMLQRAKDRNVTGVVQLVSHCHVATISDLHQGLEVGPSKSFATLSDLDLGESSGSGFSFPEDLALSCLVISPLGYRLDEFQSIPEFLEACCGAIQGHRSLYLDGNILHQDISPGNIIILEKGKPEQPRGMLIDLDLAIDLAVGPSRPGERVGTMPFMAIGVLQG